VPLSPVYTAAAVGDVAVAAVVVVVAAAAGDVGVGVGVVVSAGNTVSRVILRQNGSGGAFRIALGMSCMLLYVCMHGSS
jgi:hypothetical protein